jgi:trk system potassium uptake protein TrkH
MRGAEFVRTLRHPAQLVVVAFVSVIALGTALLYLPWSTDGSAGVGLETALFMSTSATTVTGLATVDISTFSIFGELVILALIQIGGFGIMTIGSVFALLTLRRIGLRQRMLAQAEIGAVDIGELSRLVWAIARITVIVEAGLAAILFVRFWQAGYDDSLVSSAYDAVFHAISSFNNAGISLYPDSFEGFAGDPWVLFPVTFGFIVGGLGFPVYVEILNRWRNQRRRRRGDVERATMWSLHAQITVGATIVLLIGGPLMVLLFEWTNPETIGGFGLFEKLSNSWFQGVTPRTAGFNTIDIGAMNETTLLGTIILMFVGAGPASTSGGIKVTTAAMLAAVMWAEMRGEGDVNVLRRRIPTTMIRQGLTIALLAIGVVGVTTLTLMETDGLTLTGALFESTSAFGTVGLSTGPTGSISIPGQLLLTAVMICGRVGPLTFVTAIALRDGARLYRHPEERPIIG